MPILGVNPGGLDFGDVTQGQTAFLTLTLFNNDPYFQINVSAGNASPSDFSGFGSVTIDPGGFQVVSVAYTAGAPGSVSGALEIISDADNNPVEVGLAGNSVAAGTKAINVSPSAYIFPPTLINAASAAVLFTVTNTGTVDVTVQIPVINGPFASSDLPGAPTVLAAGATFTFHVGFGPTSAGYFVQADGIVLTSDAAASPLNVDLEGQGVPILSAYIATGGVENGYMAVGPYLRQFQAQDFNCEEDTVIEKLLLLNGPGYQDVVFRVEIQYNNRGHATVKMMATNEHGQTSAQSQQIGDVTSGAVVLHQLFDLKIAGELINLRIETIGPVDIISITPRFEPAGEVKK